MVNFKIFIVLYLILLTGCSYSGGSIKSYKVNGEIPNYIVVNLSIEEVRNKLLGSFGAKELRDNTYYQSRGFKSIENSDTSIPLFAEDAANSLWGNEFYSNPENSEKIFLHSMGASFISSCYLQNEKPIAYNTAFYIEITPTEGKTKISVNSLDSSIGYGGEFNFHALGWVPKIKNVEPAKIENYKLLTIVANMLGTDLPPPSFYLSNITTGTSSC